MKVLIDADGCPVVEITAELCRKYKVKCVAVCDTAHVLNLDGIEAITVSKGRDSADFVIVNLLDKGDIVVTQDYGLGAMCLARGARAVNQDGLEYRSDNVDGLLMARHIARKIRAGGGRLKGKPPRKPEQDAAFASKLNEMLAVSD